MAQTSTLIVVATKATYQAAQRWVDFLTAQGVELKNVEPAEFKNYEKEKYVVLMGGMDEPGGIKDLVTKAVGEKDAAALSKKGGEKMYIRSSVWSPGQNVIVFAGPDGAAAEKARKESREDWMEMLAEWFDIETGGPKLGGY